MPPLDNSGIPIKAVVDPVKYTSTQQSPLPYPPLSYSSCTWTDHHDGRQSLEPGPHHVVSSTGSLRTTEKTTTVGRDGLLQSLHEGLQRSCGFHSGRSTIELVVVWCELYINSKGREGGRREGEREGEREVGREGGRREGGREGGREGD